MGVAPPPSVGRSAWGRALGRSLAVVAALLPTVGSQSGCTDWATTAYSTAAVSDDGSCNYEGQDTCNAVAQYYAMVTREGCFDSVGQSECYMHIAAGDVCGLHMTSYMRDFCARTCEVCLADCRDYTGLCGTFRGSATAVPACSLLLFRASKCCVLVDGVRRAPSHVSVGNGGDNRRRGVRGRAGTALHGHPGHEVGGARISMLCLECDVCGRRRLCRPDAAQFADPCRFTLGARANMIMRYITADGQCVGNC